MAGVAVSISAARRSRRQSIEHIIRIALLILCARERACRQALAWRCSRRACPCQPIQVIVAERLIVGPCGQGGIRGQYIACRVKAAALVKER